MNSDFRDLLKLFNAHRVRYLVVGGYAVMKYTEPRYTKDLIANKRALGRPQDLVDVNSLVESEQRAAQRRAELELNKKRAKSRRRDPRTDS
jgi:hypothetical protein